MPSNNLTTLIEENSPEISNNNSNLSVKEERRTQASRRADTEKRLLRAALEIVARRGSERMTLADVGAAAQCSRGLPAHYFGNKDGLLQEMANYLAINYENKRRAHPRPKPGLEALRNAISLYFDINSESSIETRATIIMMSEALLEGSTLSHQMANYNRKTLETLEQHILKGQSNGEIRNEIEPKAAVALLLGAMRGVMTQSLLHGEINLIKVKELTLNFIDNVLKKPKIN